MTGPVARVRARYMPRWSALLGEAIVARQEAAVAPFSLPVYLLAVDHAKHVQLIVEAVCGS